MINICFSKRKGEIKMKYLLATPGYDIVNKYDDDLVYDLLVKAYNESTELVTVYSQNGVNQLHATDGHLVNNCALFLANDPDDGEYVVIYKGKVVDEEPKTEELAEFCLTCKVGKSVPTYELIAMGYKDILYSGRVEFIEIDKYCYGRFDTENNHLQKPLTIFKFDDNGNYVDKHNDEFWFFKKRSKSDD